MFTVQIETDKGIEKFTAKSFYQVVMGEGKLVVKWEMGDGKDKTVTYSRIRTIVEKKI